MDDFEKKFNEYWDGIEAKRQFRKGAEFENLKEVVKIGFKAGYDSCMKHIYSGFTEYVNKNLHLLQTIALDQREGFQQLLGAKPQKEIKIITPEAVIEKTIQKSKAGRPKGKKETYKILCKNCGIEFETDKQERQYCTRDCSFEYGRRKREENIRKMKEKSNGLDIL